MSLILGKLKDNRTKKKSKVHSVLFDGSPHSKNVNFLSK